MTNGARNVLPTAASKPPKGEKHMKRIAKMALIGAMAFTIGAVVFPPETLAWRGGHHRHYGHGGYHHHGHFGHGSSFSLFFGFPLYGGYYGPGYGGYYAPAYPYVYREEPVRTYKEIPQSSGYVRLEIFPGETDVYMDGRYWGKAGGLSSRSIAVSAGVHQLQLSLGGYSAYYRLDVLADKTALFNKNLSAAQ
jgi:hypothetical protein